MSNCPAPDTLERFAFDFLEPDRARLVATHVKRCAPCRRRIAAAEADGQAIAEIAPARKSRRAWWIAGIGVAAAIALALGLRSAEEPAPAPSRLASLSKSSPDRAECVIASPRPIPDTSRAPEEFVMGAHGESGGGRHYLSSSGTSDMRFGGRVSDRKPNSPASPADEGQGLIAKHYGTHAWREADKDNLSTFALDVDDASYTMTRRYLREGRLPDPAAVRVEEFVNAFKTRDAAPDEDAFAIHLEAAPSPFAEGKVLLRVCAKTRALKPGKRPPCTLTFVVDCSGSMNQPNRLELAKTTLLELVDRLGEGDQVGIVVYDDQARTVLRTTDRKDDIRDAIRGLRTGGSTNAEAGLRAGFELAAAAIRPGVTSRVILCSDGVANVGRTGPEEILKVIASERERGIRLTTVGFGMGDYNDLLMEQLANKGNGRYHYVDDLKEARRVFGENLGATLEDVAEDAKIQVEFDPAVVKRFRQVGYENRALAHKDFRNDKVDAGEVGPGHSVTALYEIELADPQSPHRLARVTLRYKEPSTKEVVEAERSIPRPEVRGKFTEASLDFQLAATAAAFAEVLRKSEHAKSLSLSSVAKLAQRCSDLFDGAADARELLELVRIAETLAGAGEQ